MHLPTVEERLSNQELRRRERAVRAAMQEQGYDGLLLSGTGLPISRGHLRYLTNWCQPLFEEYCLFPLVGESMYFSRYVNRANVQRKALGLNARFPEFGSGMKTGTQASGRRTSNIPPEFVAAGIREAGVKRLGICGPESMSGDFYFGLLQELESLGIAHSTATDLMWPIRLVKSPEEQQWLRESAAVCCLGWDVFKSNIAVGRREYQVFAEVEFAQRMAGCEGTFYTMARGEEPLQKYRDMAYEPYAAGDLVFFNTEPAGPGGYHCQFARTLVLGEPDAEIRAAYDAVLAAQVAGEAQLRPGRCAADVFAAIKAVGDERGYKLSQHPGHGMGLDMFEPPLMSAHDTTRLEAGMMITLHPRFQTDSGRKVWIGDSYLIHEAETERITLAAKDLTCITG